MSYFSRSKCAPLIRCPSQITHSPVQGRCISEIVSVAPPRMPLVVYDFEAEASSRLVSIRLAQLTLRLLGNWRGLIDDSEKVMILLAVAAISGERFTRGEPLEEEFRHLRPTIPGQRVVYGNASSIAAATGFNRETTRRKLNQLVDAIPE